MQFMRTFKSLLRFLKRIRVVGVFPMLAYSFRRVGLLMSIEVAGQPVIVRARSSDMRVAIESLTKEYAFLSDLLPPHYAGLVVDAGGYIGTAAIAFARRFPEARIVTIEPSSDNFAVLKRNVQAYQNIFPVNAALGDIDGAKVTLSNRGTGNWGFTTVSSPLDGTELETVTVVTLSSIAVEHESTIDFLKLDIEGGEKLLFDSQTTILSEIPFVFVELHDRIVGGCESAFRRFSENRWIIRFDGEKFLSIRKNL